MDDSVRVHVLAEILTSRIAWFSEKIERAQINAPRRWAGHRRVFELFTEYVDQVRDRVDEDMAAGDIEPTDLARQLRLLMTQFVGLHRTFDDLFSRDRSRVPQSLPFFVQEACRRWELPAADTVITVGKPGNFTTRNRSSWNTMFLYGSGSASNILSIAVPEHEGTQARWLPITLGHELAHHYLSAGSIPELEQIESQIAEHFATALKADSGHSGQSTFADQWRADEVLHEWVEELVCDAYAVDLFGPAAVAASLEFLHSLGDPSVPTKTHPPTSFRAKLMLQWLSEVTPGTPDHRNLGLQYLGDDKISHPPSDLLCQAIGTQSHEIWEAVRSWSKERSYNAAEREPHVQNLADLLLRGIPGAFTPDTPHDVVDIVNAYWRAHAQGTQFPIDRLALKAIDDLYFIKLWKSADGVIEESHADSDWIGGPGVLTNADFRTRINSGTDNQISITPMLPGALGPASVDLRLSNQFIVFEQTSNASFNALEMLQDPRSMQSRVEKHWGDEFYLHPGQMVLASTLEYIMLPSDLCAQVITRSSYGRLGLLSATAVQVHPGFRGCLTLELVNLGKMPLAITPGERVAQLMFFGVSSPHTPTAETTRKYECPTGPEFSKIKTDPELSTLRNIRNLSTRTATAATVDNTMGPPEGPPPQGNR
ncbi:dCTP deaminase [Mycobacteroides abscessus]|uniref:dCTP deaminase n=1 Tax=Mycobacteroides abscessus TaxID=36809 RepID=UPI000C258AB2|nr:dCTP deaminase [Mycobacteroides abscessus]